MTQGDYTIFIVDDDPTGRLLLQTSLATHFSVETFETGEACLDRVAERAPDLFILDVGLPGIDGYEVCRRIKADPDTARVPVVFLSGHDGPEDILSGYEAGGEDYVVKPFDIVSLHHKVENLRRIELEKRNLAEQAHASDELASMVMANLDEYAILIKFLRTLSECGSYPDVVAAIQNVLGAYHLDGAVQIRLRQVEKTFSKSGENWPLELAVISHVRTMGRIFEFKDRAAFNFDRLTVLITNMPIADAELCGRIRDNVSIAAESADAKLTALQSFADNSWMQDEITRLLQGLGQTVEAFGKRYEDARLESSIFSTHLLDDLTRAFAPLGLTAAQEDEIVELVKTRVYALIDTYDIAGDTQKALAGISERLTGILHASRDAPAAGAS